MSNEAAVIAGRRYIKTCVTLTTMETLKDLHMPWLDMSLYTLSNWPQPVYMYLFLMLVDCLGTHKAPEGLTW